MLCEQRRTPSDGSKDDDVDATDVLSEYDKELKTREKIIEELREELNALKSASDRIDKKFRASLARSSRTPPPLQTRRLYSFDENFERANSRETETLRRTSISACAKTRLTSRKIHEYSR